METDVGSLPIAPVIILQYVIVCTVIKDCTNTNIWNTGNPGNVGAASQPAVFTGGLLFEF
jgi:hypothetical protein